MDKIREEFEQYFDENGKERTLRWIVKNRPGWTQSRMAFYREHFKSRDKEIKKLKDGINKAKDYRTPMGSSMEDWFNNVLKILEETLEE